MDHVGLAKVERASWRRTLFYVDLAVFALFGIAIVLVVRHSFLGGQLYQRGDLDGTSDALWLVVGDTVFLVGSLGWILYRFFRNAALVLVRRA